MTEALLSLYALCGTFTFWVVFTGAASVVWPVVLLAALELSVLAVIGSMAAPRRA
jgi:hypothetical protein